MSPLMLGLLLQGVSNAADAAPSPAPRFFGRPLDYWQQGLRYPEPVPVGAPPATGAPGEWGQVVKLPDGSFSYQELPPALVRVLEQPTPEHLKAYFEWKLGRTRKILRAAELMKEYRATLALPGDGSGLMPGLIGENPTAHLQAALAPPGLAPHAPVPSTAGPRAPFPPPASGVPSTATPPSPLRPACGEQALIAGGAPPGIKRVEPFRVLYFRRDGCPPCTSQDAVLASWLGSHPEARLERIGFGEQPELWRTHRVRGTPSLVLQSEDGTPPVFREGLQDAAQLDAALDQSRRPQEALQAPSGRASR